jgi:hypothetical protein
MTGMVYVKNSAAEEPDELTEHFAQLHDRLKKMTSILEKIHDELLLSRQAAEIRE